MRAKMKPGLSNKEIAGIAKWKRNVATSYTNKRRVFTFATYKKQLPVNEHRQLYLEVT